MTLRSRYGFAAFWFLSLLAGWSLLRLALLVSFGPAGAGLGAAARALLSGGHRDVFVGLWLTVPLLLWMTMLPQRWWPAQWHRTLFFFAVFIFWFVEVFLWFAEYFFFEEFRSRFNTVAVDYVLYPKEVFVNIWESYRVGLVVALCAGLSLAWLLPARKFFRPMWLELLPGKSRWVRLAAVVGLAVLLVPTIRFRGANAGADRTA